MYLIRRNISGANITSNPNKYYEPNGTFNTISATNDIQMPNCTQYCMLRSNEALQATSKVSGIAQAGTGFGNAKNWYANTQMEKGSTPRPGSIAVFTGTYGHVAFVEDVVDSTHCNITQSSYDADKSLRNYKYWEKVDNQYLVVGSATISGVGALLGYIYLPVDDVRVSRNTLVNQVRVTTDVLRVRTEPSLSGGYSAGCFCPKGYYNVLDTRTADGYTWYKIDTDCWIANVGEPDVYYYPAQGSGQYTVSVTVSPSNAGVITGEGSYYSGDSVTLIAEPVIGYVFSSWSDGDVNREKTITVTSSVNLTATFTQELSTGIPGIDISEFQRGMDLEDAKDAGKQFAILRAGFTGSESKAFRQDSEFVVFYNRAKEIGLPVGAYWFSRATSYAEGVAEAEWMINNCLHGRQFEYPIVMDVEDTVYQQQATAAENTQAIIGFCETLIENGYYPSVYSYLWFYRNKMNLSDLTQYDKWVAYTSGARPSSPQGHMWQYTVTQEAWYDDAVDLDYAYVDYDTLIKNRGLNGFGTTTYTISVQSNNTSYGTVSGGGTYVENSVVRLTATPTSAGEFVNWTYTTSGEVYTTDLSITLLATENISLTANFAKKPVYYTVDVIVNPSGAGQVSGGGSYIENSAVILDAAADYRYTFTNWTINGSVVSTEHTYSLTLSQNTTVTANFTVKPVYTVNLTIEGAGTVTGSGEYISGEEVTLTATPESGCQFLGWYNGSSLVSSNATYSFTIAGNISYTAKFTQRPVTITLTASPAFCGVVLGDGTYTPGTNVTLTAIQNNTNYKFLGWFNGSECVSKNNIYPITVNSDINYVAKFYCAICRTIIATGHR